MQTVYRFYDYRGADQHMYTATFTVDWSINGNTITINSIRYNNDPNVAGWHVSSAMRFGIQWEGDSSPTTIVEARYNATFIGGEQHYTTEAAGGGLTTVSGVLGVFSDANSHCPISHTFSGGSAGFKVWFGSTAGTLNYGNPGPYRLCDYSSGEEAGDIELDYRPGERLTGGSWKSLNREGGACERIGHDEMRTVDGGTGTGDPPEINSGGWKNQKKIGAE